MKPVVVIDQPSSLHALVETLSTTKHIAIDTESNSFYAYVERVCLIQISTDEEDFIVDPLALGNIAPLRKILANPDIEKIFHAASNDVAGLKRDFEFHIQNLFDTAVACKMLGCKQLGLARILEENYGVHLNKKWQRCDWGKRPLKEEQLNYARLDTHYLIPLRHRLHADLQDRELWDDARESFDRICEQEVHEKNFQPESYIQIRGARSLDDASRNVLKALYVHREREAQRRNRAPFRILSNETLIRLARVRPTHPKEFSTITGIPHNYRNGRGARILVEVIQRASEGLRDEMKMKS